MRRLLLLAASVLAVACGPAEGGACPTTDAVTCASTTTMLACEGGRWVAYPCPSCSGQTCTWKGAPNGASCPRAAATQGTCTLDGRLVGCFWSDLTSSGLFVESACPACVAGKSPEELGLCTGGRCRCQ